MWTQDQEDASGADDDAPVIVDWDVFSRARSALGPGFIRILGYIREDGAKAVAQIEAAMRRKDAAALVTPAGTLASEARQFGADPLADVAEEIEEIARRCLEMKLAPDELLPAVAKLRPLYEQTIELIEREANPLAQRRRGTGRGEAANQEFGRI